jgi:hypothetical protein
VRVNCTGCEAAPESCSLIISTDYGLYSQKEYSLLPALQDIDAFLLAFWKIIFLFILTSPVKTPLFFTPSQLRQSSHRQIDGP